LRASANLVGDSEAAPTTGGKNIVAKRSWIQVAIRQCPLSGVKRTSAHRISMSAFDPKWTSVERRTAGGTAPRNKRRSFAAFAFTGRGLSWPPQMPGQRQLSLREAALPQILPILPLPSPRTDASVRHISYKCVSRRVPCAWRRRARMRRIRSLATRRRKAAHRQRIRSMTLLQTWEPPMPVDCSFAGSNRYGEDHDKISTKTRKLNYQFH